MTATTAPAPPPPAGAESEPIATKPARRVGRFAAWAAIVGGIAVVAFAMTVIGGISQLPARGLLDPHAAGPEGARAIAQILEREGVQIELVRDREAAGAAIAQADGAVTLAWGDTAALSDETVAALSTRADDVVLLTPRSRDLRLLFDGAAVAGFADGETGPECTLAEAQRAGVITPGTIFTPGGATETTACYPTGDGAALLLVDTAHGRTAAIDAAALLTNETLAESGNAALGINLLGRHATIVWYLPALSDSDFADAAPSLGDLTPDWVTPSIVLLLLATVAAAFWRGRRFGPLVSERLPVTVRAGETTEGRARLYARAGDPTHAVDQLRIGTLRRLARLLALGPSASAQQISDAAAARLGADPARLRRLLVEDAIASDRDLAGTADALREIESTLRRIVHGTAAPERNSNE